MVQKLWLPLALTLVIGASVAPAYAVEKLSTVAPVADLVTDAEAKIKELEEKLLKDNDTYTKGKKKQVPQAAGTLAMVAQAIAEHDEDSKLKKSAPDLRDAAISIAKSASFDDAKKGLAAAKEAIAGKASGAKLEHAWDKLIDMDSVMSEVNARNSILRKGATRGKPGDDKAAFARDASVLAVLGVVIEADTHLVKDKGDIEKWKGFSKELQKSSTEISKILKGGDQEAFKKAFLASSKSCSGCHSEIRDK